MEMVHFKRRLQPGFTLIELMIGVAIVATLVALALPAYQNYTLKAKFTEVYNLAVPYQLAVAVCVQTNGDKTPCNAGAHGIPPTMITATKHVNRVDVAEGRITVTPTNTTHPLATLILNPTLSEHAVTWDNAGSGCLNAQQAPKVPPLCTET